MDEDPSLLNKERVVFAGGLLAVLIALGPSVGWLHAQQTPVFGDIYRLSYGYVAVASLLGMSLYLYASSVALEKRILGLQAWADRLYVAALLLAPASIATFFIGVVQAQLFPNQQLAEQVARIVAGLSVVLILVLYRPILKGLKRLDAARRAARAEGQAGALLQRGLELHRMGFYDMSIVAATNGIVAAAKGAMPAEEAQHATILKVYEWLERTHGEKFGDLPVRLREVRALRNKAAHGELVATELQARTVLDTASRLIAVLTESSASSELMRKGG